MNDKFTVIFDFDGTLANTLDLVARIYNEHHGDFGSLPIDMKDLPRYQKLGYKKAMKELRVRWTVLPKLAVTIGREMKQHMDEVDPYPGVIKMLYSLQEQGVSIGVLTSNDETVVQEYLDKNGFPEFDFLVSERAIFGKDKALKRIVKRYDLDTSRILYVGDEPRDVSSCHKAGINIIGVSWGLGGVDGLTPLKPNKIVHNSKELHEEILKYKL